MITIHLEDLDVHEQSFEFVVDGKRTITLSFNSMNLSLNIPQEVPPRMISTTKSSFFLRTEDR